MKDSVTISRYDSMNIWPGRLVLHALFVALVVIIIFALYRAAGGEHYDWLNLLDFSFYTVAIALLCALFIGMVSSWISRRRRVTGFVICLLIIFVATVLVIALVLYLRYDIHTWDAEKIAPHFPLIVSTLTISMLAGALGVHYHDISQISAQEREKGKEQRLQALQSRIRPHFLFNSMNSVASLIGTDPERAERLLEDLADVFRVLLVDARKLVPLNAEIELTRRYLNIERSRLGERLEVEWNVESRARSALIPTLTLQPLLENAVYHGIEPRFSGGTIDIDIWRENDEILINITNPMPDVPSGRREGNKIAQNNVRERLARHFGPAAELRNTESKGRYIVRLRIPVVYGAPSPGHA